MADIVIDASALLALLNQEAGADLVAEALPRGIISSVNVSEVMTTWVGTGSLGTFPRTEYN